MGSSARARRRMGRFIRRSMDLFHGHLEGRFIKVTERAFVTSREAALLAMGTCDARPRPVPRTYLGAEVDAHHIALLQDSLVPAVRCEVRRDVVDRAAGREPDAGLRWWEWMGVGGRSWARGVCAR